MTTFENQNALRTIKLYGTLGAKFGRVHRLAVASPAEAIRAMGVLFKGFNEFLIAAQDRGVGFCVFTDKENLSPEQLRMNSGLRDIRIAPMIQGKKAGVLQIIAGAVLVVIGAVINHFAPGNPIGSALIGAGIGMVLGGIIQLLSPIPKDKRKEDTPPSYAFNGPVNTRAQGNPVPLLYGELIVGSAVVSGGIIAEDVYIPTAVVPGPGTGTGGGGGGRTYFLPN